MAPERRYRLVVTAADVTTGQLVRLPWDYRRIYGLDPDEQLVADAVRASMSIPFFFKTTKLTSASGLTSTLVDGGMLSNFPIDSFDRRDGKLPRWPTFGVTLLPNLPQGNDKVIPALAPVNWLFGGPPLIEALITTMIVGRDQAYLNQPWVDSRAIRVDSSKVGFLDFKISPKQMQVLYQSGHNAAEEFLESWDWDEYLERFRRPALARRGQTSNSFAMLSIPARMPARASARVRSFVPTWACCFSVANERAASSARLSTMSGNTISSIQPDATAVSPKNVFASPADC